MEHFYQRVPGFMSARNTVLFDHVVSRFSSGGVWVELGSWLGRSAAYCVVELINANKLGDFVCVDTWAGGEEHRGWQELSTLYQDFEQNILPIRSQIRVTKKHSWEAADDFQDRSVDFCYVDAGHTYQCVTQDLRAWWPKIKPGCLFAGDDYTKGWPEVQQAVWDFFGAQNIKVRRIGRCWAVTKS